MTTAQPEPEPLPVIREMPDQQTLAEFLAGVLRGVVTVIFNSDQGKFERVRPGPEHD